MGKKTYLVTFLQAYLLSIGAINQLIGIVLEKKSGVMVMNLVPVAGLVLLHFFLSDKKNDLNMDKKALLFVYYIISVIAIYKYASGKTTLEYEEILVYIAIPIYLSFYKIDAERLLKYLVFISVLLVPYSEKVFFLKDYSIETIGMSTSYNVLPFVVAAIIHFWYHRKNAGFLMWIGYGINIYYLTMVIMYGNRGPMISLFVLAMLLFLHKFDKDDKMKKNRLRATITVTVVTALVIVVVYNFEAFLYELDSFLNSMGIKISALKKAIYTIQDGDLSNGRGEIFAFAIKGIKESPFIGNGIASMYHKSYRAISYPHNLFLQFWYDLGVFVSIPLLWVTIKATIKTLFKSDISKSYASMLILLFTLSIPRLCYSYEFWADISFWFLIMCSISPNIYGSITNDEALVIESEREGAKYSE